MRKTICFLVALTIGFAAGKAAAQTCPNPLPTCSSQGNNVEVLNGSYGCTIVTSKSDGTTQVGVAILTAAGLSTINGSVANNSNQSSGTTYQDFSTQSLTATGCINSDNTTGYLTPQGSNAGCPLAMTVGSLNGSNVATQFRLLDTTEGRAGTIVCKLQ